MQARIVRSLNWVRHGLIWGALLGIIHVALISSDGLFAQAHWTQVLTSSARHMGILGLLGGCVALIVAILMLPFQWRLANWLGGGVLVGAYAFAWLGFGAKFALTNHAARPLAMIVAVILVVFAILAVFLWRRRARNNQGQSEAPKRWQRLAAGVMSLALACLIMSFVPVPDMSDREMNEGDLSSGKRLEPLRQQAMTAFAHQRWNLLLLTIDTLRADHLGCYGYERPTSPALDALAATGMRFDHALCQRPKTSPSFATILTGTYPAFHGINGSRQVLAERLITLAEVLSDQGWVTGGVITNGNLYPDFGFDQGFATYLVGHKDAASGTDLAIDWLASNASGTNPWFLWVHHTDPHMPYQPPGPYQEMFGSAGAPARGVAHMTRLYDGEIRFTDDQVARLIAWLAENSLLENTMIVFTADHGESLGEHRYYYEHGLHPYEPSSRIPLVLCAKDVIPEGVSTPAMVGAVDIMPTILDALGVAAPADVQGHSFLPTALGLIDLGPREFVYIEAGYGEHVGPGRTWALRRRDSKYVHRLTHWAKAPRNPLEMLWSMDARIEGGLRSDEYYDLRSDPAEVDNVLRARSEEARMDRSFLYDLAGRVARESAGSATDQEVEDLSPEALESLKSLGYIK